MPHFESLDDLKISPSPTFTQYQRRRDLLASHDLERAELPAGFPLHTNSPSVWSGGSLDIEKLAIDLTHAEIQEIEEALHSFKDTKAPLNSLSPDTFKLPSLSQRLRHVSNELHKGRGVAIIRGLQPESYSMEDNVIIHAGISGHVAAQRGSQSGANDQVWHICSREETQIFDLKSNSTAEYIPFHTDDTDILAFYTIETSMSGGEMLWASHGQVYNELAINRPEVLATLANDQWPLQTSAEPPTFRELPLLYTDDKGPYFWLARGNFTGGPRTPRSTGIPGITDEQADALDAVHFTAAKYAMKVTPKKGEMYFVNNFTILHSRTAFTDEEAQGSSDRTATRRRHILRLWLRDPDLGRNVAKPLKGRWDEVFNPETSKNGRWLLHRDMEPNVISEKLFKALYPPDNFNSCQNR